MATCSALRPARPYLQASCCTCIMVAVSGAILAVLAVTDPLKPEARGVVAALARRGLAVHLVTGDNWRTARAIAEQLAIVNVCAECLPGAKADKIKVVQPHLSQCYTGVAISGKGTIIVTVLISTNHV